VPTSAHDSHTSTVLKGVVRVEALPTPSDHIPALMERVKPIYLSRTYGVPLPNPDDPTTNWEPEAFLDKLARMKGRLLKQAEPDLEAVAKIMLSDWVRGRIPFFIPPPERSDELNRLEAKKQKGKEQAAKASAKGKGKAAADEQTGVPGVKQNLGSIMQKNNFLPEDVQPVDEEFGPVGNDGASVEEEDEDSNDTLEEEEEELTWNDVFEGIKDEGVPDVDENGDDIQPSEYMCQQTYLSQIITSFPVEDVQNEEDVPPSSKKEARMKTNKVRVIVLSSKILLLS